VPSRHHAAPGIVRPLRPPQPIEIAILGFGIVARKHGYAGQSTSPDRDIRRSPRRSGNPGHYLMARARSF
jgi:hypothetical protein